MLRNMISERSGNHSLSILRQWRVDFVAAPIAKSIGEGLAQGLARERLPSMAPVTFGGLEKSPLEVPEFDVGLFGHVQRPIEQRTATEGPSFTEPGLVDEVAAIVAGAFDAVVSNEPLGCVHAPALFCCFASFSADLLAGQRRKIDSGDPW